MASKKAGTKTSAKRKPAKAAATRGRTRAVRPAARAGRGTGASAPKRVAAKKGGAKAGAAKPARAASRGNGQRAASGAESLAVGDSAPSFVLMDETGNVVSSESLRGTPYVLYFYPRDDTPGCTLEACGFRDSLSRFNAKGVRVVGVSADSPESHARFRQKYGLEFQLLSDQEKTLARAYGVWVKKQNYGREYMGIERSTFVVDRRGKIKSIWRGVRVPGHVQAVLDTV